MRPKKLILLAADNETLLGLRSFMLRTRGYAVVSAEPGDGAMFLFRRGGVDLVMLMDLRDDATSAAQAREMKAADPCVPVLITSRSTYFDPTTPADAFLTHLQCSPMELLERARVMVARKRGPKKRPAAGVNLLSAPAMEAAHA